MKAGYRGSLHTEHVKYKRMCSVEDVIMPHFNMVYLRNSYINQQ